MRATIQLCTYNRADLLARVLDACFEQTVAAAEYEVVLVDDGSTDGRTGDVIARAQERAPCAFTVLRQQNSGLAAGRNNGIAHARGERIAFIDDDVLPLPDFVEEHLRSHAAHPLAIVRGAAINVESFDDLPPPVWTIRNYSGNFFWTTNVSVPLKTIRAAGGFNETFAEYGWEDIDVGLRLRFAGVKAVFNKHALVYHYKPRLRSSNVEKMLAQARAQARTAVQLAQLHPHWRTYLATGDNAPSRLLHKWMRGIDMARHYRSALGDLSQDRPLNDSELRAAARLRTQTYFDELERARTRS
ncbi:MAG TPA: glycosyltransferase [Candidatus Baltobacteraceae bacterium]|jgi:glycosyltransferase involved in cell wall biosynthesis|nr:glycosyltransferase [Candidatus Baltobacteraceae bacterium]